MTPKVSGNTDVPLYAQVSDDEDDTHPNIDTPSLFRWRHQARVERMEQAKKEKESFDEEATTYVRLGSQYVALPRYTVPQRQKWILSSRDGKAAQRDEAMRHIMNLACVKKCGCPLDQWQWSCAYG